MLNEVIVGLFEGTLPLDAEISGFDVEPFCEALILEGQIRCETANRIDLAILQLDTARPLLRLINAVHGAVSDERFKTFWSFFRVSLALPMRTEDLWCPHILWNGGLLFRNYHRVLGADAVTSAISVSNRVIRTHAQEVSKFFKGWDPAVESKIQHFGVLDHGERGFVWTLDIPESFSDVGQTVVLVSLELIDAMRGSPTVSEGNWFLSADLRDAANASRLGLCIVRTFKEMVFVSPLHRVDADYDTILGFFSYALDLQSGNERIPELWFSTDYLVLLEWVAVRLHQVCEEMISADEFVRATPALHGALQQSLSRTMRREQGRRLHGTPAFFINDWQMAANEPLEAFPFLDLKKTGPGHELLFHSCHSLYDGVEESMRGAIVGFAVHLAPYKTRDLDLNCPKNGFLRSKISEKPIR